VSILCERLLLPANVYLSKFTLRDGKQEL